MAPLPDFVRPSWSGGTHLRTMGSLPPSSSLASHRTAVNGPYRSPLQIAASPLPPNFKESLLSLPATTVTLAQSTHSHLAHACFSVTPSLLPTQSQAPLFLRMIQVVLTQSPWILAILRPGIAATLCPLPPDSANSSHVSIPH